LAKPRPQVFQPDVYAALLRGSEQMVRVVSQTYGPLRPGVLLSRINSSQLAEQLDDGGLIARRIYALADRDEDVGAMLVRHLMWRMREQYGDGSVTAALIFQSAFRQGVKLAQHGVPVQQLRQALVESSRRVMQSMSGQILEVKDAGTIRSLAASMMCDPSETTALSQAVLAAGAYGSIDMIKGNSAQTEVFGTSGSYWKAAFFTRKMMQDVHRQYSAMGDCHILVSNLMLSDPVALAAWLVRVRDAGVKRLVMLAREMTRECQDVLESARAKPEEFDILSIKLWETTERWELGDLALVTGGHYVAREAGRSLADVTPESLGRAGKVWIERERLGIVDGAGDARALGAHISALIDGMERERDKGLARRMRTRIAGLRGNHVTVAVGGRTLTSMEEKLSRMERLVQAITGGVLPGGGLAYLACLPRLQEHMTGETEVLKPAERILSEALKAPFRMLLRNAGYEPEIMLDRLEKLEFRKGINLRDGQIISLMEAGVVDSARAWMAALYAGVSAAAQALSVEVVIHPKKRRESYTTG